VLLVVVAVFSATRGRSSPCTPPRGTTASASAGRAAGRSRNPDKERRSPGTITPGTTRAYVNQAPYPRGLTSRRRGDKGPGRRARFAQAALPASDSAPGGRRGRRGEGRAWAPNWGLLGRRGPSRGPRRTESPQGTRSTFRGGYPRSHDPKCGKAGKGGLFRLWVAPPGGGNWAHRGTTRASAPAWTPFETGWPTNAFGALIVESGPTAGRQTRSTAGDRPRSTDQPGRARGSTEHRRRRHWSLVAGLPFESSAARPLRFGAVAGGRIADEPAHDLVWEQATAARANRRSKRGAAASRRPAGHAASAVYVFHDGRRHFARGGLPSLGPDDPQTGQARGTAGVTEFRARPGATPDEGLPDVPRTAAPLGGRRPGRRAGPRPPKEAGSTRRPGAIFDRNRAGDHGQGR